MAKHHYATQMEGARAVGRDLPISAKHSQEVCNFIRGKNLHDAQKMLEEVVAVKRPVPYTKHLWDLGHKPGMANGRYPVKTSREILRLLKSVEVNAQFKGMNTSQLHITHIASHVASRPAHSGRHRGQRMKRAHVEIIVREQAKREKKIKEGKKSSKRSGGSQ